MKNYYTYFFIFLLMISCGKKEEKKETIEAAEPQIEEVVKKSSDLEEVPEIVFTVQIAALKKENTIYNNVEFIKIYKEDGLTKYRLGEFLSYKEARETRTSLLIKYPDAFIQALRKGLPVHIKEALKD